MTWLKSKFGSPDYLDIGHQKNTRPGSIILWCHDGNKLLTMSNTADQPNLGHEDFITGCISSGRIDTSKNKGSIAFDTSNIGIQQRIINDVISKFPSVNFFVFGEDERGRPESLQSYYERIASSSQLTKTSELNGEYFIDDSGYASYADGDTGDYNHEMLAVEAMIGDEQLGERFGDYMYVSGQPLTEEERQAIDDNEPGFLDYMERGGEAREWVIEKHNWIRVHGENFQLMNFDQDAIKRIADFLGEQLMDADEESEVCIEEKSSGRMECFSPQEIFDAKQDPNKATRLLLKMRGTSSSSSAWGPETWRGGGEDKMMPIASSVKNWLTKISKGFPKIILYK